MHVVMCTRSRRLNHVAMATALVVILSFSLHRVLGQEITTEDFKVDCIRPLGMRITPSANFRVLQTGCRGADSTVVLQPPYDVSSECMLATNTGTAVQIILEDASSSSDLVGGLMSRVFVVSCDFPGSEGYEETLNRPMPAVQQPAGINPTATSGVFKYTGILMAIIDKATFTAARWAEHLMSSAFIGQELYLTISHSQRDEGQAYIIPRSCRVKPETGNFTTLWNHESQKRRCFEVSGIAREPIRVFTDSRSTKASDVMSLQFYGFQFLGYEDDVITFECDLLLCGDVTGGTCLNEWRALQNGRSCMTTKPPPQLLSSPRKQGMKMTPDLRRSRSRREAVLGSGTSTVRREFDGNGSSSSINSSNNINNNINTIYRVQQETLRVNIRMSVPRTKLQHVASGNTLIPSSAVALLLTSFVRLLQDG